MFFEKFIKKVLYQLLNGFLVV